MSHIFLYENSPILCANNFCKWNFTIHFIKRNFLAMNLNKYWQKIMFAKKQYQNEYVTLLSNNPYLDQNWWYFSKWNHAIGQHDLSVLYPDTLLTSLTHLFNFNDNHLWWRFLGWYLKMIHHMRTISIFVEKRDFLKTRDRGIWK